MRKIAGALLASLVFAMPAAAEELRVSLPGKDLILDLPAGWRSKVQRPKPDSPPTIGMTTDPARFQMLVTPIWPVNDAKAPTAAEVRRLVDRGAEMAKSRAVEKELKVVELGGAGKTGYYFAATDSAPEPNGYKHMIQGAIGFDELRITFTILSNGDKNPDPQAALGVMRSMRRAPPK